MFLNTPVTYMAKIALGTQVHIHVLGTSAPPEFCAQKMETWQ